MEVGVHLPQVATTSAAPDVRRVREVVDAARDLGLAAVSANDHLSFHRPWLDGPTLLAAVADRAAGLDLATTVALPSLRGPVQLATALSTLATIAPGRVVAGVGPGSSAQDHALAGVPFDQRWPRFEESLWVLRALLHGEEPPSAWTERLTGARVATEPVPLWVASWGSPAGLRRVARLGDGWLASAYNTTPAAFADGRRTLAAERDRLGRAPLPAALATMWTWVDDDPGGAERVLRDVLAPLVRRDPDELRGQVCVGTPAHCAAILSAYAAAGCRRVYVWPLDDEVAQLDRLVEEVLPMVDADEGGETADAKVRRP
jgi:alkanesulfonate monooxygenase SsuD/methylene tetrahydromethanopterin reductase-like flavin-dependent oxidoreductase (luciferase family)